MDYYIIFSEGPDSGTNIVGIFSDAFKCSREYSKLLKEKDLYDEIAYFYIQCPASSVYEFINKYAVDETNKKRLQETANSVING